MAYKYDSSDAHSLVKVGEYEALIESLEVRTTPNGKNKLTIMFRIRTDVDQAYRNKVMYKDIWEDKEEPDKFNVKQINKLLGTQPDIKNGQEFENINKIIDFLTGKALIIHIAIEFDNYRGEDVNTIDYFKKSKVGAPESLFQSVEEKPSTEEVKKDIISTDDLPF